MILFYKKDTGQIYATIDGRVHDERALNAHVTDSKTPAENVGKYIIGWIEKDGKRMGYNLDQFETLQRFEDLTPESPLDYQVIDGVLSRRTDANVL